MKSICQRDICILLFTIALVTITKEWKQARCPSAEGQLKTMWYISNITQSLTRMSLVICSNMDATR